VKRISLNRRVTAAALAVICPSFSAAIALAQEAAAPPATTTSPVPSSPPVVPGGAAAAPVTADRAVLPDGRIVMNFRNASLDSVLTFLSEAGGLTVLNDTKLEGRVNVISKQPMTIDEALAVLDTVLKDRGYASIRRGKTLKIVPLDDAKKATIPVFNSNDPKTIAQTDEVITQVVPVRFADAVQLKKDLAPLVPTYADLSANASTNTLIITDTSSNVRRIVEIVAAMDTTVSTVSQVKVFPLQYANASNTARLINEVFAKDSTATQSNAPNRGGGGNNFFARMIAAGGPGGGGLGGFGGGGAGSTGTTTGSDPSRPQAKVTASADERTSNVVVSAPADVMPVIEQVVKQLDSNPAQNQGVFIYRLRNAQAVNVQNVINNLFGAGTSTGTTSTANRTTTGTPSSNTSNRTSGFGGQATGNRSGASGSALGGSSFGNSASTGSTFNSGASTAAAPRLSSGATQSAADLAGQVYAVADLDTNSVLITTGSGNFDRVKTVLAELDRPVQQVLIKALLAEVTHTNKLDLGVEFSAVNMVDGGSSTIGTQFGVGSIANPAGGLVYKFVQGNYNVAIDALQRLGKIDVLSRPYILASDNQQASIIVGQTVPYITYSQLTDTGQTNNSIAYTDIGIILNVTPHINPDGLVVMDVGPEISSIDTSTTVPISSTVNATVFTKRSAQTRVAIKDGQTIVIGGLMQDQKNSVVNQVPLLGDIPFLGELFKRTTTTTSKTELLIFLTPHVAREPDRLGAMSAQEQQGAIITPKAVGPGVFDEHLKGLQRGADPQATQPSTVTEPAQTPSTESPTPAQPTTP
jgi:general secretion pathway protein D